MVQYYVWYSIWDNGCNSHNPIIFLTIARSHKSIITVEGYVNLYPIGPNMAIFIKVDICDCFIENSNTDFPQTITQIIWTVSVPRKM